MFPMLVPYVIRKRVVKRMRSVDLPSPRIAFVPALAYDA